MKYLIHAAPWAILLLFLGWIVVIDPIKKEIEADEISMTLRKFDMVLQEHVKRKKEFPDSITEIIEPFTAEQKKELSESLWFRQLQYFPPTTGETPKGERIIFLVPYHQGAIISNAMSQQRWLRLEK